MATKPYFLWGDTHASSDSDVRVFVSGAPETAAAATAAGGTAVVSPDLGTAAGLARPRLRRNSSGLAGKQQQQVGGGGAKKPPQRGLGVAELERLRCGRDPLRELSAMVVDAAGAQGHPLFHYHHHHHLHIPPSPYEAGARYGSELLAPAAAPPTPPGPVCFLQPAAAVGCQRAPLVAPEQQYFSDQWGHMGGFAPAGDGTNHQPGQLLPAPMAPEHPSSQSTIWCPAASYSSCLHTGHRCDICCRRMRALAGRGAVAPMPPASPNAGAKNNNTMPDYSVYDLAAAMATARQGGSFLALERQRGAAAVAEAAPAKKEVREIEFFPAASTNHTGGGGARISVPDESEPAVPFSSPYAGRTAPQLDLSLRL